MSLAPERIGIGITRHFTTAGVHPYDEVVWERRDARITNWKDGAVAFEQLGRGVPGLVVAQRHEHRGPEVLPGDPRHARAGALAPPGDRPRGRHHRPVGRRRRLLRRRGRGRRLPGRAEAPPGHPEGRVQLTGLVQHRRGRRAPAGQRLLHPVGRRHDGLDPQLVPGGGGHLQGRLGRGRQPVEDPLQRRAAERRWHGRPARSASCAAPTRRRHDQVAAARPVAPPRWSSSTSTTPTCRSSSGARSKEERKARVLRDAGFDMDLDGADSFSHPVPERQQLGSGDRRVHAGGGRGRRSGTCEPSRPARSWRTVRARDLWREIADGGVGVRRPRPAVRHHDQPLAHGAGDRADQRLQPLLGVHAPRQLGLQPGLDQPPQVPGRGRTSSTSRASATPSRSSSRPRRSWSATPTTRPPSIAETSRSFRQLGLGYANLGAMLMALGLPYDTGEGRAWAAAITSLMTGHAYATSARIASRMGPFAGFAANEEHMLRRPAPCTATPAAQIDEELVPGRPAVRRPAGVGRARCADGEEFGVRNSQASGAGARPAPSV